MVSSRGANRNRIHWLEEFVRAWDGYVEISQKTNTVQREDPSHPSLPSMRASVVEYQHEVIRARNRVGVLT